MSIPPTVVFKIYGNVVNSTFYSVMPQNPRVPIGNTHWSESLIREKDFALHWVKTSLIYSGKVVWYILL